MTLKAAIKNLRESWYARDGQDEYYLSVIMDTDWSTNEVLNELIIPAVKWMEQEESKSG